MVGKIVSFEGGYRLKVKYWFMLWYMDPGFPTFDTIEKAEKVAYEAGIKIKKEK